MRRVLQSGAIAALVAFSAGVGAQTGAAAYPSKPIRVIVPYAPGGSPDSVARVIGQAVGESIGQQVIAENRPGGAGVPAAEAVIRAAPDGYTLLIADSSVYAITPSLSAKPPFEPLRDLAPVSLAVNSPLLLVVNASVPAHNVREFVALAKAKPGMAFGSSGNATVHHLAMEMLRSLAGVEFTHVPYKGAGQSVPAVVAGDVAAIFAAIPAVSAHAKAGKVRILGIAAPQRTSIMPELPTISEAGVPGCELTISIGFLAPAKTPPEIVRRLSDEIVKALKQPEVRQRLSGAFGFDLIGTTPEQYSEAIRVELQTYGKLARTAGVQVN